MISPNQSFFSLEDIQTAFASAIDEINIYRFDGERRIVEEVPVALTSSPPSNLLLDIRNDSGTIRLPVVSIVRSGWSRDPARIKNKDNYSKLVDNKYAQSEPIPINMNFTITILCLYMWDLNQIQQKLVQYLNPQTYQFINDPLTNESVSLEIIWGGSWTENIPTVVQEGSVNTILQASTSFTVKGYLWLTDLEFQEVGTITKISNTLMAPNGTVQWKQLLKGKPFVTKALNAAFIQNKIGYQKLWGMNMDKVKEIYLSGGHPTNGIEYKLYYPNSFLREDLDVYCDYTSLSSECVMISGIPITSWSYNSNSITFDIPPMSGGSIFDIVLANEAGCCVVTDSVRRTELQNPFLSSDPLYSTWLNYQHPYSDGFTVFSVTDTCTLTSNNLCE